MLQEAKCSNDSLLRVHMQPSLLLQLLSLSLSVCTWTNSKENNKCRPMIDRTKITWNFSRFHTVRKKKKKKTLLFIFCCYGSDPGPLAKSLVMYYENTFLFFSIDDEGNDDRLCVFGASVSFFFFFFFLILAGVC